MHISCDIILGVGKKPLSDDGLCNRLIQCSVEGGVRAMFCRNVGTHKFDCSVYFSQLEFVPSWLGKIAYLIYTRGNFCGC